MDGDGAGGYSVGTLDKPTTRLSQYARGKTGSMNPFTPGGEVKYNAVRSFTLLCSGVVDEKRLSRRPMLKVLALVLIFRVVDG